MQTARRGAQPETLTRHTRIARRLQGRGGPTDVARPGQCRPRRRTLWKAKSSCLSFSRCGSAPCRRNRNFIILCPPPPPPRDAPGPAGPAARGGAFTEARDATDARPTHDVSVPAVPRRPLLARQWARTGPPGSPGSPGGPGQACALVWGLLGLVVQRWVCTVGSWAVVSEGCFPLTTELHEHVHNVRDNSLAPPDPTFPIFAVLQRLPSLCGQFSGVTTLSTPPVCLPPMLFVSTMD